MNRKFRHLLTLLIVVFCGVLGWQAARDFEKSTLKQPVSAELAAPLVVKSMRRAASPPRRNTFRSDTTVEIFASSKPQEVILRFPSEKTYGEFLSALVDSKVQLVNRLDRLRAVRLGYDQWADLSNLLHGENITTYDSLPAVPAPRSVAGESQTGLVALGESLLPWLGVTTDHTAWGEGVTVAVLDTGIIAHPTLPGLSRSIAITPFPADLTQTSGHGTAVASLIAGNDPRALGVAPAAKLISIRVADDTGKTDAFALAQGILAGVDAGVQIINISMGTSEDNPLIEEAVLYAHDRGVVIVAAAGNSERAEASYPAAYPSVISVGAVDGRGEHLNFSNFGTYLSLTAPGYAIDAAWPMNSYTRVSGTSASAPIVSGAIAATMSSGRGVTMTATQAAEIVMQYSNEAGIPGPDSEYGVGILDLGRVMNRQIPGIVDAAITHQRIVKTRGAGDDTEVQVTLQNRGTTQLEAVVLEIQTQFGSESFDVPAMAPGTIETVVFPLGRFGELAKEPLEITSRLSLGDSLEDITPLNNLRMELLQFGEIPVQ